MKGVGNSRSAWKQIEIARDELFEIYDSLPPAARKFVQDAPLDLNVKMVRAVVEYHGLRGLPLITARIMEERRAFQTQQAERFGVPLHQEGT